MHCHKRELRGDKSRRVFAQVSGKRQNFLLHKTESRPVHASHGTPLQQSSFAGRFVPSCCSHANNNNTQTLLSSWAATATGGVQLIQQPAAGMHWNLVPIKSNFGWATNILRALCAICLLVKQWQRSNRSVTMQMTTRGRVTGALGKAAAWIVLPWETPDLSVGLAGGWSTGLPDCLQQL